MIHLQRWLISMGAVLAAYLVYAVIVAPWVEPPPRKTKAYVPTTTIVHKPRDFSHLFAADAWQNQDPKVIETETSLLLFLDFQPQPDGKVNVTPCSVIMFDGKGANRLQRPIVLDAPAGAIVQFDKEIDVSSMKVGELQGGMLPGDIRIFRVPSSPEANDGLELTTRNVKIDMQRVWTPHEVKFRYGSSYGSGRDLKIELLPQDKIATTSPGPLGTMGGLQHLQLAVVDVIHVVPPAQGLAGGIPAAATTAAEPQPKTPPVPLEIRCRGPFQFDFQNQLGSFDDRVEVLQLNPLGPPDSLRCQRLAVRMRSPEELAKTTAAVVAGSPKSNSVDDFKSKIATFEASGEQVVLNAPSQGAYVSAAKLAVDFMTNRVSITPGANCPQVTLRYGQQAITTQKIDYEFPATGRLGNLWCEGSGEASLVQVEGKQSTAVKINWRDKLRLLPTEMGDAKVLSLAGEAKIAAENLGSFAADEIFVWLRELPPSANPPAKSGSVEMAGIEPDRLLATGRVEIDTQQLAAHTKRFEAWFAPTPAGPVPSPTPTAAAPALTPSPAPSSPGISVQPISTGPPPVSPPSPLFNNPGDPPLAPLPPEPPANRFDVTGDLIRAQLLRLGPTGVVEDLAVEGHVNVLETQTANVGEAPVTMQGTILQLQKGSTTDAVVQIVGQPAVVTARGMKLVGASVKMHRGENRIWIDGPGEADVPLGREFFAPPGVPQIPQDPAASGKPQIAKVLWKGGAKFDGQTLTVVKNVVARTEEERQLLMAESLIVTLDRYVDFQKSMDRPPQVATLKVDGGVFLQSRTVDERLRLASVEQFQVKNFSIDQRTGRIEAEGPGWLSSSRTAGGTLPGAAAAPSSLLPNEDDKLTYLRVTFQGNIVGSITNREMQFQRQVRTVVGPIARWEDKFDPQSAQELGESGVVLTSDKMTVAEMQKLGAQLGQQQSAMEFEAAGNVMVEGKGVVAKAQRIRYSTAKELLIVEGEGRTPAELWYRVGPSKPEAYQAARKIKFSRRLNSIEVEDAHSIDLNQINGPAPKLFGG